MRTSKPAALIILSSVIFAMVVATLLIITSPRPSGSLKVSLQRINNSTVIFHIDQISGCSEICDLRVIYPAGAALNRSYECGARSLKAGDTFAGYGFKPNVTASFSMMCDGREAEVPIFVP